MRKPVLLLAAFFSAACASSAVDILVIDPGHGGKANSGSAELRTLSSFNNATSPNGLKEKELTLQLAIEIQRQIAFLAQESPDRKLACVLTRTTDENPDFAQRAALCADLAQKPQAIVSLHFNASEGARSKGTVAVVEDPSRNDSYETDMVLAKKLTQVVSAEVSNFVSGSRPREPITDKHLHGGKGSNLFYQLRLHPELKGVPKCFIEVEFIDRQDVEDQLLARREEAFPQIARSIALWFRDFSSRP